MTVEAPDAASEYRDAVVQGANLAWEERWDGAGAAFRRALAARPGDAFAERQLAMTLERAAQGAIPPPPAQTSPSSPPPKFGARPGAPPPDLAPQGGARPQADQTSGAFEQTSAGALGRTMSRNVTELATLPPHLVHRVVEGMCVVERYQTSRRFAAAFDEAYALLQLAPTFFPLHILLAELYTDIGAWEAVRDKLDALEATSAARAAELSVRGAA
jgi:hypothetical protein